MNSLNVQELLTRAIGERHLLDHPFYQRWQEGNLSPVDLQRYAEEYRYIEAELPRTLATIANDLVEGDARQKVQENLDDELANPIAHTVLFESFADAVGAEMTDAPSKSTKDLVDTYRALAAAGPTAGLAGIAAYEVQAGAIATTKGESLREHYRLTSEQTSFWDLHATIETDHAMWTCEVLAILPEDDATLASAAQRSAEAWWNFLDDRERESELLSLS